MEVIFPDPRVVNEKMSRGPGLLWLALGDSHVVGAGASNAEASFFQQAVTLAGGLVARRDSIRYGRAGETTAQILARVDAAISSGAQAVILGGGTNDASEDNNVPFETTIANRAETILRLRKAGLPVIVLSPPPRSSAGSNSSGSHLRTAAIASWTIQNARALGATLVDAYGLLMDPATGYLVATSDGVHLSDLGHAILGAEIARAMRAVSRLDTPTGAIYGKSPGVITDDPLQARTSPLDSSNWGEWGGGSGTAPAYSFVNDVSGFLPAGRWTEMDFNATAGGVRRLTNYRSGGFSAGQRMLLAAHVQIEDMSGTWRADVASGTSSFDIGIIDQNAASVTGGAITLKTSGIKRQSASVYEYGPIVFPFTTPSGATELNTRFTLVLPSGKRAKMRVGAAGLINLTARGDASLYSKPTDLVTI